jgi:hypothetical protein
MTRRGPAGAGLFRFSTESSLLPQTQPRNFAGAPFAYPPVESCVLAGNQTLGDCPGSTPAARITRALASSPAHPHRPGRVRRVRAHGGGPLPARLRPHPATLRWRVGAWQPSLAGRAAADRSCDPCPATCDGSSVPARRADAGRGVTPVPDRTTGGWYGCDSGSGLHRSRAQTVALSVPIRYAGAETYRLRCRR